MEMEIVTQIGHLSLTQTGGDKPIKRKVNKNQESLQTRSSSTNRGRFRRN